MNKLIPAVLLCLAPLARAQSLFASPPAPVPAGTAGHTPDAAASLYGASMFAVQPPKQHQYKTHDLVTIIVQETSKQAAEQNLKTDKTYTNQANLNAIIDPMKLLELQIRQGSLSSQALLDANAKNQFNGKGTFERNDDFTMKIQAEVIDVKPNGVLVLEARKTIDKSGELQTTILSGNCRLDDITTSNTVLSTQLANLTLVSKTKGHVNDAGKKGFIARALDSVFSF